MMLREDCVERLHEAGLGELLLKLLGTAGCEANGETHAGIECVRSARRTRFGLPIAFRPLHDVVDRAKGNGNYDQLRELRRTADGLRRRFQRRVRHDQHA
jgi:hypothetical protein